MVLRARVESSVSSVASEWQLAGGGAFGAGLALGGRGAARLGDRIGLGRGALVGEKQLGPGLAQVPGEVVGERAEEDVRLDAVLEAVVDGTQLERALELAEGALNLLELLVGAHDLGRFEL
jgi:hypothetical protein